MSKNTQKHSVLDFIFIILQYLTPKKLLTRCGRWLANNHNHWIKTALIRAVAFKFKISLDEYERKEFSDYATFQDFFTRQIDLKFRPLASNSLVSPSDGKVSATGIIDKDMIFQAKGLSYSLESFLGSRSLAEGFHDGSFLTTYLAPSDYHRVHMPTDATLVRIIYIPGELFSVNQFAVNNIPNLFATNERAIFVFESREFGTFALAMVAATMVSGIKTSFAGVLGQDFQLDIDMSERKIFQKGDELGQFLYGSTTILLFEKDQVNFKELATSQSVKMGETLI